MDEQEKISFLENGLEKQLHWISASDAKSAFVFTAATAMLAALAAIAPVGDRAMPWATTALAIFAAACQLTCLFLICLATFPRTDGPKNSLIYCGGIASMSAVAFQKEVQELSSTKYLQDLGNQVYRNAEIAAKKFSLVRWSLIALFVSLVPWLMAVWCMSLL